MQPASAAPDKTAFAVGLTQTSAPGTVWAYNNSAIQTLERVVAGTLGADVPAEAQRRLFAPLGMDHTEMTTDRSGHATMYAGIRSTCRDLARFGSLFLARGDWNGTQIVSRRWVQEATGAPSTPLNAGYGLLWWLNRRGRLAGPLAATSLAGAADTHRQAGPAGPGRAGRHVLGARARQPGGAGRSGLPDRRRAARDRREPVRSRRRSGPPRRPAWSRRPSVTRNENVFQFRRRIVYGRPHKFRTALGVWVQVPTGGDHGPDAGTVEARELVATSHEPMR